MEDKLREIIDTAVYAPSGHNYQPWSFIIKGNEIFLKNLPENDKTIFNYKQRGSFIAIGAVIENIAIIASHMGYNASPKIFPEGENSDLVAEIEIIKGVGDTRRTELFEYIKERRTNRKPYKKDKLSPEIKDELLLLPEDLRKAEVKFIDNDKKESVAKSLSLNDWLIFNNRTIHKMLFGHIVWTEEEEKEKKSGLYIETFELPLPIKKLFKLFRYWFVAKILGFIGFGKMVSKQNAIGYASSSAIGGIYIPDGSPKDFVLAGRTLQHLWLRAVKLGLSMQIVVGILYLYERIKDEGRKDIFSANQEKKILDAGENIIDALGNIDKKLVLTFRIGVGAPPSASSSKKEPVIKRL